MTLLCCDRLRVDVINLDMITQGAIHFNVAEHE